MANFKRILTQLRSQRDRAQQELQRLEDAIRAIEAINPTGRGKVGRPSRASAIPHRGGRMSAAARRKLSRLLKQRWAQGKMKRAKASRPRRRMTRAARKKIATAQRARWAKVRAQQQTER